MDLWSGGWERVMVAEHGGFRKWRRLGAVMVAICNGAFRDLYQSVVSRSIPIVFLSLFFRDLYQLVVSILELFRFLNELDESKDFWTVKVRIIRVMNIQDWRLDVLLIDENGNKMQGLVRERLIPDFQNLLLEDSVIMIRNCGVGTPQDSYPIIPLNKKLIFYASTEVVPVVGWVGHPYGFFFKELEEINLKLMADVLTVDIIGVISWCGNMDIFKSQDHKETKRLHLDLQNLKFRVQFRVQDHTGTSSFLMFDQDVNRLTDLTAADIRERQLKSVDGEEYPYELQVLVNRLLGFQIVVTEYNTRYKHYVYTVVKICDDQDIIAEMSGDDAVEQVTPEHAYAETSAVRLSQSSQGGGGDSKDAASVTNDSMTLETDKDSGTSPLLKRPARKLAKSLLSAADSSGSKRLKKKLEPYDV